MGHTVTQVEAQMASVSQGVMSIKKQGETTLRMKLGGIRANTDKESRAVSLESKKEHGIHTSHTIRSDWWLTPVCCSFVWAR